MKLIDRDELLRNIEADIDISVTGVRNMEAVKCCLQNILDDVKESPVVDAVPVVHGHWKYDNQYHWYRACCSECGYCRVTDVEADRWNEWKYCPNCGARMDEHETD